MCISSDNRRPPCHAGPALIEARIESSYIKVECVATRTTSPRKKKCQTCNLYFVVNEGGKAGAGKASGVKTSLMERAVFWREL